MFVELTGATIAVSSTNKPIIFYEAFCIPPLPEELELPAPRPIKEEQDLWKQWTKRYIFGVEVSFSSQMGTGFQQMAQGLFGMVP